MRTRSMKAGLPGRRPRREGQRGSSIVEMAIMAPILTAMVLWLVYFWEMHTARIRAAEAARYIAWQRTATASPAGIGAEAKTRFSDLDSSTPAGAQGTSYWNRLTIQQSSAVDAAAPLVDAGAGAGGLGGVIGSVASLLGGSAVDPMVRRLGFNTRAGAVQSAVQFRMDNRVIPRRIGEYIAQVGAAQNGRGPLDLVFTDSYYTYFDTWRAWQPGNDPRSTYPAVQGNVRGHMNQLTYLGVMNGAAGSLLSGLGYVVSFFDLDFPLSSSYITDATQIYAPNASGRPLNPGPTRTSLGDPYYAAYWYSDGYSGASYCQGLDWWGGWCEPSAIRDLRKKNNVDYRAYNCRGNFYLGTTRSGYSEYTYAYDQTNLERSVFRFNNTTACQ
jgi:hypothetical protein